MFSLLRALVPTSMVVDAYVIDRQNQPVQVDRLTPPFYRIIIQVCTFHFIIYVISLSILLCSRSFRRFITKTISILDVKLYNNSSSFLNRTQNQLYFSKQRVLQTLVRNQSLKKPNRVALQGSFIESESERKIRLKGVFN